MIEKFRYSKDHKEVEMDDFAVDETNDWTNDEHENNLLNKMKQLKDELQKTRGRIFAQKKYLDKTPQHRRGLTEQDQSQHKLKRHLMNADSQEKSVVTLDITTIKESLSESGKNFTFLYQDIFSTQNPTFLSCQDLPQSTDALETVGSGYTKKVTKANIRGRHVALKQANRKGHDGTECAQYGMAESDCYSLANYKVLKELALLQQLKSPHIIQVRCTYMQIRL